MALRKDGKRRISFQDNRYFMSVADIAVQLNMERNEVNYVISTGLKKLRIKAKRNGLRDYTHD